MSDFTPHELRLVIMALWRQGKDTLTIAQTLSLPEATVYNVLSRRVPLRLDFKRKPATGDLSHVDPHKGR